MTHPIRILVTEDHAMLRHAIGNLLESQADMVVIGKASNGAEAVEMAHNLHPDIVLMDYEMPEKGGVRATKEIVTENPNVAVIGFSSYEDEMVKRIMVEAGAAVVLSKNGATDDLFTAIRERSLAR